MARIRTIKPEFFRSPSTAKVDPLVRIFYQALWCWADDFGIGETNVYGWLGFAFPDDQEVYDEQARIFRALSAQDLRRFCADCAQHYGVVFYSVRERHYYAINNWDEHQKTERRNNRRKYPTPDDPEAVPDLQFQSCDDLARFCAGKPAQDARKTSAGTGEQGNRGTGEEGTGETTTTHLVSKRSVSNARDENAEESHRPLDRMGRPSMSLAVLAGGAETSPPAPPTPDRRVSPEVREIVNTVLPAEIGRDLKWSCQTEIAKLINSGADTTKVTGALRRWLEFDDKMHPGNIKYFYAKIFQEETQGRKLSTADRKAAGWLAMMEKEPDDQQERLP